jgi:hypothetical protein
VTSIQITANYFAQTEPLMMGKTAASFAENVPQENGCSNCELLPYMVFDGIIPTNSLLFKK